MHKKCNAYQICYDEISLKERDSGFNILNNFDNPRSDWREYWSIREFFIKNTNLNSNAYYGFVSPKFYEKTGILSSQVIGFIDALDPSVDVISFSPYFDQTAAFINSFEQGEVHHPGLMSASREFLRYCGMDENLVSNIGHSRNTIYCNYFFAKPNFWNKWIDINEILFDQCEKAHHQWAKDLNDSTRHSDGVCPMKVFLVERIVSLMLAKGDYNCVAYKPSELPMAKKNMVPYREDLQILDALKIAYCTAEDSFFMDEFYRYRSNFFKKISA